jgi:hypothetical protein
MFTPALTLATPKKLTSRNSKTRTTEMTSTNDNKNNAGAVVCGPQEKVSKCYAHLLTRSL